MSELDNAAKRAFILEMQPHLTAPARLPTVPCGSLCSVWLFAYYTSQSVHQMYNICWWLSKSWGGEWVKCPQISLLSDAAQDTARFLLAALGSQTAQVLGHFGAFVGCVSYISWSQRRRC